MGVMDVIKTSVAALGLMAMCAANASAETWRSQYYPEDWTPGYTDDEGRFLHDFSYAGYHRGERHIPEEPPGPVLDVTEPPYGADPTGEADSTAAIQAAIDDAGAEGGGVVYLPAGTYRIAPEGNNNHTLRLAESGVVLRGDGPDATFLFNDAVEMRGTSIILARPSGGGHWHQPLSGTTVALAEEAEAPNDYVYAEDTSGLETGDWIVLTHDVTEEFVAEHSERLVDEWAGRLPAIAFYRQVKQIDDETGKITVDIPLRYDLRVRDNARLHAVRPHLEEAGIEDLSIGNREHPGNGFGFNDYTSPGTAAYDVHSSYAIRFNHVTNGWIRRVHTYRPEVNEGPHHLLSNMLELQYSRGITVQDCDFREAQYRGGGGNGYGYVIRGNDCLIQDCYGRELRYVFDFKSMYANGNVIHRGVSDGTTSDFHMHLSVSNLMDNLELLDGAFFNARERPHGTIDHGITTNQSVFWNTLGEGNSNFLIDVTNQSGNSFIIGTRGERTNVEGLDDAHMGVYYEGRDEGYTLEPQSLYEDQLQRRLGAPDLTGLTLDEAEMLLAERDLALGEVTYSATDEQDEGKVVSQHPSAGEITHPGTESDLTVSLGLLASSIEVMLEPAGAIEAGARWRIEGEEWRESADAADVEPGEYVVEFRDDFDPAAWLAPHSVEVSVEAGETAQLSAAYASFGIREVDQLLGLSLGGNILHVRGAGFSEDTVVYLGDAPAFLTDQSEPDEGLLVVEAPRQWPGAYDIRIEDPAADEPYVHDEEFVYTRNPFEEGVDQFPGEMRLIQDPPPGVSALASSFPAEDGELQPLEYETPEGVVIEVPVEALPPDATGAYLVIHSADRLTRLFEETVEWPADKTPRSPYVDVHILVELPDSAEEKELTRTAAAPLTLRFPHDIAPAAWDDLGVGRMTTNLDERFGPTLPDPPEILLLDDAVARFDDEDRAVVHVESLTVYGLLGPEVPGDVNGDGVVNASDIQLVINEVLGIPINPDYEPDVTGSGDVDAEDIQFVINRVLGIQ